MQDHRGVLSRRLRKVDLERQDGTGDATEVVLRTADPEVQRRVFEVLKLDEEEIRRKFGFFIDALAYGTPPHAGIAFGYDRIVSICLGRDSIREVIAFPKNTRAVDMMTGAPSEVDPAQLAELRIRLDLDGN